MEHSPTSGFTDIALDSRTSKGFTTTLESHSDHSPLFFNCHEYVISVYQDIGSSTINTHDRYHSLCITHFPNIYAPPYTKRFQNTRIVRIPRRFDQSLDHPCFSTQLPGMEPAALTETAETCFTPRGIFTDQIFGYTSLSPLSNYLTPDQWYDIANQINEYMKSAYNYCTWYNFTYHVMDVLTLGIWDRLCNYVLQNPLVELEKYIESVNESDTFKEQQISIISPRLSGYLSVSIKAYVYFPPTIPLLIF